MPSHLKTYQRKTRLQTNKSARSVDAVNALFAENLTKRLKSRRKGKVKLKELPPRTGEYLTDDSFKVEPNNTFDKLLKGKVFNNVNVCRSVRIKSIQSSSSNSIYSPIMTRNRKKSAVIADASSTRDKNMSTLSRPVTSSLSIEKETGNHQPNFSSLSYIKVPVMAKRQLLDRSDAPFFSDTFRERHHVHSSTPHVGGPGQKIITDTLSPITKSDSSNSSKLIEKSYDQIRLWDESFPALETPRKSHNTDDWKLGCKPRVYLRKFDADEKVAFTGWDEDEQTSANKGSKEVRSGLDRLLTKYQSKNDCVWSQHEKFASPDAGRANKRKNVKKVTQESRRTSRRETRVSNPIVLLTPPKISDAPSTGVSKDSPRVQNLSFGTRKSYKRSGKQTRKTLGVFSRDGKVIQRAQSVRHKSLAVIKRAIQAKTPDSEKVTHETGKVTTTTRSPQAKVTAKPGKARTTAGTSEKLSTTPEKATTRLERKARKATTKGEVTTTTGRVTTRTVRKAGKAATRSRTPGEATTTVTPTTGEVTARVTRTTGKVTTRETRTPGKATRGSKGQKARKVTPSDSPRMTARNSTKTNLRDATRLAARDSTRTNLRDATRLTARDSTRTNPQSSTRMTPDRKSRARRSSVISANAGRREFVTCRTVRAGADVNLVVDLTDGILSEKEMSYSELFHRSSKRNYSTNQQAELDERSELPDEGNLTVSLTEFESFMASYHSDSGEGTGDARVENAARNDCVVAGMNDVADAGTNDAADAGTNDAADAGTNDAVDDSETKGVDDAGMNDVDAAGRNAVDESETNDIDESPEIKDVDDWPEIEDVDDLPETKDVDDCPKTKDVDDCPETKDADDVIDISDDIFDATDDEIATQSVSPTEAVVPPPQVYGVPHDVVAPKRGKIVILSDITLGRTSGVDGVSHDHSYSSPHKPPLDHSYSSPYKATPVKQAFDLDDDLRLSDIIESSFETPADCAVVRRKPKPKSINLKAGKSYRRSLSVLRNSVLACPEGCECQRCCDKERFSAAARRRASIIVPATRNSMGSSHLEQYARIVQEESLLGLDESSAKVVSARFLVLQRCGQTDIMPFEECYPDSALQNCHKIGEGVYGEVFLYKHPNGDSSVMKVIPIEGDMVINGERQKRFEEILSEIVIAMELSNLRKTQQNATSGFSQVKRICCTQGRYPERLLDLWDLYDETKSSENESPRLFPLDQKFIVLELANGGKALEEYVFDNAKQAFAMFQQTACALAVAEAQLQFEHRDLHWGNVLLHPVDKKKSLYYRLGGQNIEVETCGVEVAIIDFTLSRIEFDGVVVFNDLALDEELFMGQGDYQFEIYRLMQKSNGNEWQHYEGYTNILWLHYILDKITQLRYKNVRSNVHKQFLAKLEKIKAEVLSYNTVTDYVNNFI